MNIDAEPRENFITEIAGLQYYEYWNADDFSDNRPKAGDPVVLVRQPDNHADPNAIEVIWKNNTKLGYIPRELAKTWASWLDDGIHIPAVISDPGDGSKWSLVIECQIPASKTKADNESSSGTNLDFDEDEELPF